MAITIKEIDEVLAALVDWKQSGIRLSEWKQHGAKLADSLLDERNKITKGE
jgi:hypothetical protein